jgi:hypothetical protein
MPRISICTLIVVIAGIALVLTIIADNARIAEIEKACAHSPGCGSNIKYITMSLMAFHDNNKSFPLGTWSNPSQDARNRLSWIAAILPYLDNQELHDALDRTQPWDAGVNRSAASTKITELKCRFSRDSGTNETSTNYVGIAGLGLDAPLVPKTHLRAGVFGYDRQTALADIKDGTATTMIVAESAYGIGSWL